MVSFDKQMEKLRAEVKELETVNKYFSKMCKGVFGLNAGEIFKLIESKKASVSAETEEQSSTNVEEHIVPLGKAVAFFYGLETVDDVRTFIRVALTSQSKKDFLQNRNGKPDGKTEDFCQELERYRLAEIGLMIEEITGRQYSTQEDKELLHQRIVKWIEQEGVEIESTVYSKTND